MALFKELKWPSSLPAVGVPMHTHSPALSQEDEKDTHSLQVLPSTVAGSTLRTALGPRMVLQPRLSW